MALEDLLRARREKLDRIRAHGLDPYPEDAKRTASVGDALAKFSQWARAKKKITLAGRLTGLRYHGGVVFGDLKDQAGAMQLVFKRDTLGDTFELLQYFDIGDFLSAEGILFTTNAGEKTLEVREFWMLAKSLRPLPSAWHGLEDVEERFRKRSLDLLANPEVFERFLTRSKTIWLIRQFLDKEGFLEVETPMLQTLYGGAAAKPFRTQLDILRLPLYLRIAPELYLKRLLVGGFEKIYEIGRVFRNEGMDREHNPEFTMLELYWAYQDRDGLMDFCEELFTHLLGELRRRKKNQTLLYEGKELSFTRPWRRVRFTDLIKDAAGLDYDTASEDELRKRAQALDVEIKEAKTKEKVADMIYKKVAVPQLHNPTFVVDHPVAISPLAKRNGDAARRFQIVIAGWEVTNAFAELNDPLEQRARFEEQEKNRRRGDEEAHPVDEDFIEILEYGMPPAAGLGIGIDRVVALFTNAPSLKEVILFPFMKPREK